jgi:hypothetical protein
VPLYLRAFRSTINSFFLKKRIFILMPHFAGHLKPFKGKVNG